MSDSEFDEGNRQKTITMGNDDAPREASREFLSRSVAHIHAHMLDERRLYSPQVSRDSYLVVFDTGIEIPPEELYRDRSRRCGDNRWIVMKSLLATSDRFVNDRSILDKRQITVAPDGYLKCSKD